MAGNVACMEVGEGGEELQTGFGGKILGTKTIQKRPRCSRD